jgi:hypothetical protein
MIMYCLPPLLVHCRLAFADALAKVADPVVQQELPIEAMLSQERATQRYKQYFNPDKVGVEKLEGCVGFSV